MTGVTSIDTIEIVLGAFNNRYSAIRNSVNGDHIIEVETDKILNCYEMR